MNGRWCLNNFFLLVSCIINICMQSVYATNVTLAAQSLQGTMLKSIGVGKPFALQVTIENTTPNQQEPTIKGIQTHKTGIQVRTVNGITSVVYTYRAVITSLGSHKIGPALVQKGSTTIASNVLELEVEEYERVIEPKASHSGSLSSSKSRIQLYADLHTDKRIVYEREKIPIKVRFLMNSRVEVRSISCPSITENFIVGTAHEPTTGYQDVNGERFAFIEWQWNVYPRTSGSLVIPPFFIEYEQPAASGWGHFFSGIGFSGGTEKITTNAIALTVKQVSNREELDGIAEVSNLSLTATPQIIKQGDGMVISLEITGDESIETIDPLLLYDMPASIRWSYSKEGIIFKSSNIVKRNFEYIAQVLESGEQEIPSQAFTFFSPEKGRVIEFVTDSVFLTVEPNVNFQQEHLFKDDDEYSAPDLEGNVLSDDITQKDSLDYGIMESGHTYCKEKKPFSWLFFWILMICPLFLVVPGKARIAEYYNSMFYTPRRKIKKRCHEIKKDILRAKSYNDPFVLYGLFITFFKDIESIFDHDEEVKKDLLARAGITANELQQWHAFFDQLIEYCFDRKKHEELSSELDQAVFDLACEWVDRIYQGLFP